MFKENKSLCYQIGHGPALVILPSPLIMSATYHHLAKALSSDFHVVIPELPASGFHFSKKKVWKADEYAQWILNFLKSQNLKQAILMGHSNSGAIAIIAALQDPIRIQHVVLADTVAVHSQFPLKVLLGRALDGFLELFFSAWALPHLLMNLIFHFRNFIGQVWMACRLDLNPLLKEIRVPVHIFWGRRDHTMPLRFTKDLQNQIQNSNLYISPKGSHDWI